MNTQWYELTFKQLQPLHIGMGNYGIMAPTQLFLPGNTMWGALTCAYGHNLGKIEDKLDKKEKNRFTEISNFYPVIDGKTLFPDFKNGELCFGNYSEIEFRYEFTDTTMSTSILPENQSAKDQGLHEIEVLLPFSKGNNNHRLLWRGILKIEEDKQADSYIREGLTIIVGGESGYGFGMMKLQEIRPLRNRSEWNLSENNDGFKIEKNDRIAHFSEGFEILKGVQSPWYHVDKKDRGFQADLIMVWHPGSLASESVNNNISLKKGLLSR
ncbi:MAG: RAMP superfamily CRISPR-associated protein [Fidelibacterota bacterium]